MSARTTEPADFVSLYHRAFTEYGTQALWNKRRFEVGSSGIRAIRERTSLSQSEFAQLIGVSVKTLQNWEQDRRRPTGPAAALLSIIEHDPALAVKAIHRV